MTAPRTASTTARSNPAVLGSCTRTTRPRNGSASPCCTNLGHHLLATSATHLLDDIDRIGHSPEGAKRTEELVCHAFAGNLLVPEALVDSIMAGDQLVPQHVVELHAQSWGSWEAVSVRASERIRGGGAVLLIRDPGIVAFCAARGVEVPWWPRGSALEPNGVLFRAHEVHRIAEPD